MLDLNLHSLGADGLEKRLKGRSGEDPMWLC